MPSAKYAERRPGFPALPLALNILSAGFAQVETFYAGILESWNNHVVANVLATWKTTFRTGMSGFSINRYSP